jgi:protein phosphatase
LRGLNEDAYAIDARHAFAFVADGMGGHNAGEVASGLVARTLHQGLLDRLRRYRRAIRGMGPARVARKSVAEANRALLKAAAERPDCQGMGTTLALLLLAGDRVALLHIGDSRIYRLRDGKLEQLTRDDSLLADQVQLGLVAAEDANASHNRHLVTAALGRATEPLVHARETAAQADDVYLLCTDGLSDLVEHRDIELIVDRLQTNLALAAEHLVQLANDLGGNDNITVVLARIRSSGIGDGRGLLARLFGWLRR